MTYKEFKKWCNNRACDGRWGMTEALTCIGIIRDIENNTSWFQKLFCKDGNQEKRWKQHKDKALVELIVRTTDKIINTVDQNECI